MEKLVDLVIRYEFLKHWREMIPMIQYYRMLCFKCLVVFNERDPFFMALDSSGSELIVVK
jgi:hypothetical protein